MAAPATLPITMPAIAPPERPLCDEDDLEEEEEEDEPEVDVAAAGVPVALAVVSTPAADVSKEVFSVTLKHGMLVVKSASSTYLMSAQT